MVRGYNPTLRIHKTTKSQIDLKELFDLRAYSAAPPLAANQTSTGSHEHHDHAQGECSDDCGPATVHNSGISTVLIPLPTLDSAQYLRFNDFLETLLWSGKLPGEGEDAPEILRTKGLIKRDDGSEMVLQGVADLFELKSVKSSGEDEVGGKVVFIGRRVDDRLKAALYKHIGI